MKRICLIVMLLALFLTGCAEPEPATVATISPGPVSVTVSNVDEFLAAIDHHTEIILEAGVYNLHEATGYGLETDNPCYSWVDMGYGYQLTIQNVENLTIRGNEDVEIITTPRYANVLAFYDCIGVVLNDFTAGHTEGSECAGGVIHLNRCEDAKLENLSLYGCGTTGIRVDSCKDVTVRYSEIYDCSYNAIQTDNTDGLLVESCDIHDLGKNQYAAGQIFMIWQCTDVTIQNCSVSDNRVMEILNCQPGAGIELRQCAFTRNDVQHSVFAFSGRGLVMDGCTFEENDIRNWFDEEGATVLDGIGKSWDEDMLDVWYNGPADTIPAGARTEVVVSTVDELIAAIAPDTEIVLKDGTYDLSTAKDYGSGWGDYYYWLEEFDGLP